MSEKNEKTNKEINSRIKNLSNEFSGNYTLEDFIRAFSNSISSFNQTPYIQNRKIKSINSLPKEYSEEKISSMVMQPDENETDLRKVEKHLEATTPLGDIRKTYQDILLYHHYAYPSGNDRFEYNKKSFESDERLVDNILSKANFSSVAKEITGQALQEGKVFRWLRDKITTFYVDKNTEESTEKKKCHFVNMFNLTPLPSDFIKIVGFNDFSKYTIAFNMVYFMQPGVDINDYIDLIKPYIKDFKETLEKDEKGRIYFNSTRYNETKERVIKTNKENEEKFKDIKKRINEGGIIPEVYKKNGIQYYWVVLPVDKVYPFEIDPSVSWVSPTFSNIFLSMMRISKGEQIQMEVLQNPLVAFMTASVPFEDGKNKATKPQPKLGALEIEFWLSKFITGLQSLNMTGIGASIMPVTDIKFHQMADSPNASEMATKMYQYTMLKANMGAVIPITDKPLAEQVRASQKVKARYGQEIYNCFKRMMNNYFMYSDKLKYNWRFDMFGDVFSIEDEKLNIEKDLSVGISSSLYKKYAIEGKSLLNARAMLKSINESGILEMLSPLKTSYTQTTEQSPGRTPNKEKNIEESEATQKNIDY